MKRKSIVLCLFVLAVAFSPDGNYVLSGNSDSTLMLWDIGTGKEIRTLRGHASLVLSVAFSPDGRYAVSGSDDNTLKLWEIESGKEIKSFEVHTAVNSVAFSPNGTYVLTGNMDGTTRIWNINKAKEVVQFVGFDDGEWIVITPEGYFNASSQGAKHLSVRIGNKVHPIDDYYKRLQEIFQSCAYGIGASWQVG